MSYVTVTLNPSIDLTLEVDTLLIDGVARATKEESQAAGKGVNVARSLEALGREVGAVVLLAALGAERYRQLLEFDGRFTAVTVPGEVRTNVAIVSNGRVTKVNGPGPAVEADHLPHLLAEIIAAVSEVRWVAVCGSTPPGIPPSFTADLISALVERGARVALDAGGDALRECVPARPDLCKPNLAEMQAAAGRPIRSLGDALDASHLFLARGAKAVLGSFGPAGLLYVDVHRALHASTPPIDVASDVGAGDSALAGFLSHADEPEYAIRVAAAWGRAACLRPGSQLPRPTDVDLDSVRITDQPDPALALT
jgi:1-phosphofructokinase